MVSRSASAWSGWSVPESMLSTGAAYSAAICSSRRVIEHPRGDDRVIAGERARHVLDALAAADAELVLLDIDRMTAELRGRHLHRVAGARARLLEDRARRPCRRAARGCGCSDSARISAKAAAVRSRIDRRCLTSSFSFRIMVPTPWSVRSSISKRMLHPAVDDVREADALSTASAQALSLGIMPLPTDAVMFDPLAQLGRGEALERGCSRRRHPRAGPARRSDRRSSPPPSPPRSPSPLRRH